MSSRWTNPGSWAWAGRLPGLGLTAGALLLLLSGCVPEGSAPPRSGDPLPAMTVMDRAGNEVALSDYRGRAVLLNLWATWCPPCRAEMPYFQELSEEYGPRGLAVVGVSVDNAGARELVDDFIESIGVEYDILLDPSSRSMDLMAVLGLPATFLVDPDGTITHARTGPVQEGDQAFLDEIEAILPAGGP